MRIITKSAGDQKGYAEEPSEPVQSTLEEVSKAPDPVEQDVETVEVPTDETLSVASEDDWAPRPEDNFSRWG